VKRNEKNYSPKMKMKKEFIYLLKRPPEFDFNAFHGTALPNISIFRSLQWMAPTLRRLDVVRVVMSRPLSRPFVEDRL
jgi:hypothetical protein